LEGGYTEEVFCRPSTTPVAATLLVSLTSISVADVVVSEGQSSICRRLSDTELLLHKQNGTVAYGACIAEKHIDPELKHRNWTSIT